MLDAEILRPEELTPGHIEAWTAFRVGQPAFCNPLFGAAWAQAVGRVRPDAYVAVLKQNGTVVGFLPHHRASGGLARPIGAPFSDLHALIADPGRALPLSGVLAAAGLRAFRFSGLIDPQGDVPETAERAVAHVVVQSGSDNLIELCRQRNAKRFKNWRRLGHKLDREHGGTTVVAHDASTHAFTTLLGWKRSQLRRSGLHDVYRPSWVQNLMASLHASSEPTFGGLLVSLYVGGRLIAGEFGLREGGCFHPWIAAYDPAYASYSPGILLQLGVIEQMQALGLKRYDLGAGADHYKAPMATHQQEVRSGTIFAAGQPSGEWGAALRRSRLGVRLGQRWEQIAAVETTALGRVQGLVSAVRDGPKRLSGEIPPPA